MDSSLSPFAQQYKQELKGLVSNDRNTIMFLKNLAAENEEENLNIIVAVQQHLYECPQQHQLPVLYLVDCIMKLAGGPYQAHFCPALPAMFRYVWDTASHSLRQSLAKLANSWKPILPSHTMSQISAVMATSQPSATSRKPTTPPPIGNPVQPGRQQQSSPVPLQMPTRIAKDPRLPSPTSLPAHVQPAQVVSMPMPSFPQPLLQQQQQPPSTFPMQNIQQQVPQHVMPTAWQQQPNGLKVAVLPSALPPPPPPPAYATVAPQQPLQAWQPTQVPVEQRQFPVSFPQQMPALPMQQPMAAQMQPAIPLAGTPPSLPIVAPMPAPVSSAAPVSPSFVQPTATSQDLMAALQSLSNRLGGGPVNPQAKDRSQAEAAAGASKGGQQYGKVTGSLTFHPSLLKEHDQSAIDDLLDSTNQTRRKFLDIKFLRNRRIKAAQQNGQTLTQHWYYTIDQWLVGARPDEEDEMLNEPEDEDGEVAKVEEEHNVEEDPSQPECAISGEPFDRWYDPETDKWFYSDAVVLTGDEATRHGVMDGSIVKVYCLAGAPSKLSLAAMGLPSQPQAAAAGSAEVTVRDEPAAAASPSAVTKGPDDTPGLESTSLPGSSSMRTAEHSAAAVSPQISQQPKQQQQQEQEVPAAGLSPTASGPRTEAAAEAASTAGLLEQDVGVSVPATATTDAEAVSSGKRPLSAGEGDIAPAQHEGQGMLKSSSVLSGLGEHADLGHLAKKLKMEPVA